MKKKLFKKVFFGSIPFAIGAIATPIGIVHSISYGKDPTINIKNNMSAKTQMIEAVVDHYQDFLDRVNDSSKSQAYSNTALQQKIVESHFYKGSLHAIKSVTKSNGEIVYGVRFDVFGTDSISRLKDLLEKLKQLYKDDEFTDEEKIDVAKWMVDRYPFLNYLYDKGFWNGQWWTQIEIDENQHKFLVNPLNESEIFFNNDEENIPLVGKTGIVESWNTSDGNDLVFNLSNQSLLNFVMGMVLELGGLPGIVSNLRNDIVAYNNKEISLVKIFENFTKKWEKIHSKQVWNDNWNVLSLSEIDHFIAKWLPKVDFSKISDDSSAYISILASPLGKILYDNHAIQKIADFVKSDTDKKLKINDLLNELFTKLDELQQKFIKNSLFLTLDKLNIELSDIETRKLAKEMYLYPFYSIGYFKNVQVRITTPNFSDSDIEIRNNTQGWKSIKEHTMPIHVISGKNLDLTKIEITE